MRRSAESAGFTIVEALLWGLVLVLVAGLAATTLHWARLSWSAGVERLDQYGSLRLAALKLARELGYARRIVYPPPGTGRVFHQVLFQGQVNELRGCLVDPDGRLVLATRGAQDSEEPLTRNTIRLDVKRPGRDYVELRITVRGERGEELSLGAGFWVRNHE